MDLRLGAQGMGKGEGDGDRDGVADGVGLIVKSIQTSGTPIRPSHESFEDIASASPNKPKLSASKSPSLAAVFRTTCSRVNTCWTLSPEIALVIDSMIEK